MSTRTRISLVTGGGSGIGRGVALHLAGLGHAVAVLDRDPAAADETVALVDGSGGRAVALPADVADESAVTQALAAVRESFGDVEILVNNAGFPRDGDVTGPPRPRAVGRGPSARTRPAGDVRRRCGC